MSLPEASRVTSSVEPTLDVRDLCTSFHTRAGVLPAVRNVSLRVQPGRILGLVGESGSASRSPAFRFSVWWTNRGASVAARCCSKAVT